MKITKISSKISFIISSITSMIFVGYFGYKGFMVICLSSFWISLLVVSFFAAFSSGSIITPMKADITPSRRHARLCVWMWRYMSHRVSNGWSFSGANVSCVNNFANVYICLSVLWELFDFACNSSGTRCLFTTSLWEATRWTEAAQSCTGGPGGADHWPSLKKTGWKILSCSFRCFCISRQHAACR